MADPFTGIEVDGQYPESHYPLVGMIRTGGVSGGVRRQPHRPLRPLVGQPAPPRGFHHGYVGDRNRGHVGARSAGPSWASCTWGDAAVEMQLTAGAYNSDTGNVHAGIALDGAATRTSTGIPWRLTVQYPYAGYWPGNEDIRGTIGPRGGRAHAHGAGHLQY